VEVVARFKGDPEQAYHSGIPARDLTEEDLEGLTDEQKATLAASPLYDVKGKKAEREVAAAERRVERDAAETTADDGDESKRARGGKG
jgi:hypothetical protein